MASRPVDITMGGGLAGALPASRLSEFESAGSKAGYGYRGRVKTGCRKPCGLDEVVDSQVNAEGIGPPSALIPR